MFNKLLSTGMYLSVVPFTRCANPVDNKYKQSKFDYSSNSEIKYFLIVIIIQVTQISVPGMEIYKFHKNITCINDLIFTARVSRQWVGLPRYTASM